MATIPIYNPQSPFLGLMPSGFQVGWTLKIRAQIQGFSNRCQIYIQSGPALSPRDDVMLHISVRPQENCIVRTNMSNQVLGPEERHGGNPIQAHQSFEIAIKAESSFYKIEVNNQHFTTFAHRLPMNLARFVSISGTCTISYITMDQSGASSSINHPIHVTPIKPIYPHPIQPRYPIHHHHPPPPPPMPHYPPPPYPGHYPGHHQEPTPYTGNDNKNAIKIAAGVGAAVGLTAVALGRASRNLRKH